MGPWILLFPLTYLVHIAEEHWGGFPAHVAALTGSAIPEAAFLGANALLWVLMTVVAVSVLGRPARAALVVALATIVTINTALHVGGALVTSGHSPGVVSGLLLWLPLGVTTLARGRRTLSLREFRRGVVIGVVAHALVPLLGAAFVLVLGGGWRAA